MRDELELIEKIELYIEGKLSLDEAGTFEDQMRIDASLREAVALQRDLMNGVSRMVTRRQVIRAAKHYHAARNILSYSIGGTAIMLVIVSAVLLFNRHKSPRAAPVTTQTAYSNTSLPLLNETGKPEWSAADSTIPAQVFNIDVARDTVIETKGGMVLSIPVNAFVGEGGKMVNGPVSLCIKEALDPLTILTAGLTTMSGDKMLETGGMFFIDARQGDAILKINRTNGIYAAIPTKASKANMQLFSGKRMPGGSIEWTDPVPTTHDLVAVNIKDLDFYPPEYLPLLGSKGYPTRNKQYTDSVYYSMANLFGKLEEEASISSGARVTDYGTDGDTDTTVVQRALPVKDSISRACGINPAKIKAIWDDKYQNTLLATREFNARLMVIHSTHNPALLDLYVNNLSKNLYEIDAMAAAISSGEVRKRFLQFASLRDGKVRKGSKQFDLLKDYYALKTKLYTNAITEAAQTMRQRLAQSDNEIQQKSVVNAQAENERAIKNFREELRINLKSAYHQLGIDEKTVSAFTPPPSTYGVTVTNTGWSNVDKYVIEATISRNTMDYTDAQSGKTATIKYVPVSFSISSANAYDRLLVYLLPDKLSSYIKMNVADGKGSYKLNALIKYDMVCIGLKGSGRYILKINGIGSKAYDDLKLREVDSASFVRELNQLQGEQSDIARNDVAFALLEIQNIRMQRERMKWEEMIGVLSKTLFPCNTRK